MLETLLAPGGCSEAFVLGIRWVLGGGALLL